MIKGGYTIILGHWMQNNLCGHETCNKVKMCFVVNDAWSRLNYIFVKELKCTVNEEEKDINGYILRC